MKILIVSTMTSNFGKRGSYNSQEIGLARGFSNLGHDVIVYKSVVDDVEVGVEKLEENAVIHYIKCKYIGSNGYLPVKYFEVNADVLVQFADVQLSVPLIYKWCKKNNIEYIPYVGITWSQSSNKYIKMFIEILAKRNFKIYRKNGCIAKNNNVYRELVDLGIDKLSIAPVCIDFAQLHQNYNAVSKKELREKWEIDLNKKVLLYIGRFEKDKRPIDMLKIFSKLDSEHMLIMVGKGVLLESAQREIELLGLQNRVRIVEQIGNKDIWEIYRLADLFINLNQTEIWGMVLLEAMYYKVPIIACSAPGPKCIIENNVSGILVNSDEEIIRSIEKCEKFEMLVENAYQRVLSKFNWVNTAKEMLLFYSKRED